MANEVTHVAVTLDQAMLQTVRMGLSALQLASAQAEAHLNQAVRAALDAAALEADAPKHNPPPAEANGPFKSAIGGKRDRP